MDLAFMTRQLDGYGPTYSQTDRGWWRRMTWHIHHQLNPHEPVIRILGAMAAVLGDGADPAVVAGGNAAHHAVERAQEWLDAGIPPDVAAQEITLGHYRPDDALTMDTPYYELSAEWAPDDGWRAVVLAENWQGQLPVRGHVLAELFAEIDRTLDPAAAKRLKITLPDEMQDRLDLLETYTGLLTQMQRTYDVICDVTREQLLTGGMTVADTDHVLRQFSIAD